MFRASRLFRAIASLIASIAPGPGEGGAEDRKLRLLLKRSALHRTMKDDTLAKAFMGTQDKKKGSLRKEGLPDVPFVVNYLTVMARTWYRDGVVSFSHGRR
ncbi:MAG: hypothetical protein PWP47_1850 [Synergistaceae bacterium]|jgi:hypothetical protein|nr:hypothetical protein [Synergistaceae bacterium]